MGCALDARDGRALVQLFESPLGLRIAGAKARFLNRSIELGVSMDILGRAFNGIGRPRDSGPDIIAEKRLSINEVPINPIARDCSVNLIHTGISAIDEHGALALGRKPLIISRPGFPRAKLAAQIASRAATRGEGKPAVVLCATGVARFEADFYIYEFQRTGVMERAVLFISLAGDSPAERIVAPRVALTAAEYLAHEKDMHVLVILTDIINYADALREVSAARGEAPGRLGYPNGMHADFASVFERAGRLRDRAGSVTLISFLTVLEGGKPHPAAELACIAADAQIILSRDLNVQDIESGM
jgi:V/A-type H+-transporting ATPase subunit B